MKSRYIKHIRLVSLLVAIALLVVLSNNRAYAQSDEEVFMPFDSVPEPIYQRNSICFGLGASFIAERLRLAAPTVGWFGFSDYGLERKSITPAYAFSFDRRLRKFISLGFSVVYQRVELEQRPDYPHHLAYKYVKMERLNVSLRMLAHYHLQGNFSLYSGIRLGINDNKIKSYSNLESWIGSFDEMRGFQFAPQIVGIGILLPLYDGFYFNAEACLGPPYILLAGLSGRF